ncbi:TlpA disulfide reductase family protein [Shewanella sp. NIFS-20-20]|uniref:TlpA family protein disulfide reductase n=1 Tax=Shewanella sp. NIFS-20-20 TaxID=2853806 RepID=UPI001C4928CD|nr:TlpA disulfide reductase family protein [Shewanella sp. NIFS-20-20]MBV7316964.1 TlpA family protein disulfide reductase [Shewanella sp. NIFS-20-20]
MFKHATMAFALLACSLSVQAHSLQNKVYQTGEPLAKPMQMTGFTEMSWARGVPDIEMQTVDGNTVNLSDYRGKLVLVNLWATWCPPCIKEIPALIDLKADNQDKQITILSLSIDEDPTLVAPFLDLHGFENFETLLDPTTQIEKIMPANVVPATYMFDGAGNLVGFVRGYMDWDDKTVQPFVDQLITKYADKTAANIAAR